MEFIGIGLGLLFIGLTVVYFKTVWDDNQRTGYLWKPSQKNRTGRKG